MELEVFDLEESQAITDPQELRSEEKQMKEKEGSGIIGAGVDSSPGELKASVDEVCTEQMFGKALQPSPSIGNVIESDVNTKRSTELISESRLGWTESIKQAVAIWFTVIIHASPVFTSVLVFMWIYYLPALILQRDMLDVVKVILYYKIRVIINTMSYWLTIALIAIHIFSFQFSKLSIYFAIIPGFIVENMIHFAPILNMLPLDNAQFLSRLGFITIGFILVYKAKKPKNLSEEDGVYYVVTKDGSVSALFKGIAIFFTLINFIFYNILTIYLNSTLFEQLAFRFLFFPSCFLLSKWVQIKVLHGLSVEHMSKRLIVYKVCNYQIQFIGRLMISNLSTNSALSVEYILINFVSGLLEVIHTVSFEAQTRALYEIHNIAKQIYAKITQMNQRGRRLVSIMPVDGTYNQNNGSHEPKSDNLEKQRKYIEEALLFRAKHRYDDIVSELYAIIFAPLLMYFIHRLIEYTSFQLLTSFEECFYQIIIQLVFELVSDVLSLSFEIRKGLIRKGDFTREESTNKLITLVWSINCILQFHRSFSTYS